MGIAALLTGQKRIEYLQLRKLPKLTGNGLQFVKSTALVKLDLKANINIDTKGMNHALLLACSFANTSDKKRHLMANLHCRTRIRT